MNEASVLNKVDKLLTDHQSLEPIYILKYEGTLPSPKTPFTTAVKKYGSPILVVGRAITNPTKELASLFGNLAKLEIAFVWSRLELIKKFPLAAENDWLDSKDIVQYKDNTYDLIQVKPSGHYASFCTLVIGAGKTGRGDKPNTP